MADSPRGKLGIVVGGGPAPGINGVISSVTIEAINRGLEVVGIRDGFKHLVAGDYTQIAPAHHPGRGPVLPARRLAAGHQPHQPGQGRRRTWPPCSRGWTRSASSTSSPSAATTPRTAGSQVYAHAEGRHQGGARAQDDRQRPAAAAGHPDVRVRDRPALRRAGRPQPARGRQDHRPVVHHREHGPRRRPPGAGHRQGVGRHPHHHPRGVQGQGRVARPHLRHHHRLDDQAEGPGQGVRRRGAGRGAAGGDRRGQAARR